ncbi:MAG TPA: hypothetical protein VL328_01755 [Gemmatimonadaceae bacterium]|jgi:hypothetical protein|nr:hypothetical protein [Gemmatimonadaceae bacterium]
MLDRFAESDTSTATREGPSLYLTSHRAVAACARELSRLHDAIADDLSAWRSSLVDVPADPVIRRSPARCLVQLGPVALTVAWLQRAQGTTADGELLVVVWRGAVASHTPSGFERVRDQVGPRSATALWELVLTVAGDSEAGLSWTPSGRTGDPMSSSMLARRCVERLSAAYAECANVR